MGLGGGRAARSEAVGSSPAPRCPGPSGGTRGAARTVPPGSEVEGEGREVGRDWEAVMGPGEWPHPHLTIWGRGLNCIFREAFSSLRFYFAGSMYLDGLTL